MFCDYKINSINDYGNQVKVDITYFEGDYQNVETIDENLNPIIISTYVRTAELRRAIFWFEKSPVETAEIKTRMLQILNEIKANREIIPECL